MQIIDLSVALSENTPVYPGDPTPKITPAGQIEKDGYTDHVLTFGTHVGTHIDAPLHMVAGGKSLDQIPLEQFVGRGRLIQMDETFDLEKIKAANIEPDNIVLFQTGMSNHYNEPVYFESFPALSEEAAKYLVDQKVKMVGLDTGSADNQDGFPIHKILLGGNVLIIENLTNLTALEGKEFTIYALPLKLSLDGSPTRVIAVVNED